MATLYDYYVRDSAQNLTVHRTWRLDRQDGSPIVEVIVKLHYDFDANAKYVSFYIPCTDDVDCPEALLLNNMQDVLEKWPHEMQVLAGFGGGQMDNRDLVFTGRVYFYSERPLPEPERSRLLSEAKALGHNLVLRSSDYVTERNKWERPHAFISHDSHDKSDIAEPLAIQLQKLQCFVWYDEFTLKIGDSLRESIEKGLKECRKCILVLTPNFLKNGGWSKREYDSIFTRELVEKQNLILPLWHGVSQEDVYEYSPVLADRVAARWSDGPEKVARKLMQAIDST